jgi:hypothetical protein
VVRARRRELPQQLHGTFGLIRLLQKVRREEHTLDTLRIRLIEQQSQIDRAIVVPSRPERQGREQEQVSTTMGLVQRHSDRLVQRIAGSQQCNSPLKHPFVPSFADGAQEIVHLALNL